MKDHSQKALKEWACVVRALGEGKQILLLRKGGIAEKGGEFRMEEPDFFLFPTFEHQDKTKLKPLGSMYGHNFYHVRALFRVKFKLALFPSLHFQANFLHKIIKRRILNCLLKVFYLFVKLAQNIQLIFVVFASLFISSINLWHNFFTKSMSFPGTFCQI